MARCSTLQWLLVLTIGCASASSFFRRSAEKEFGGKPWVLAITVANRPPNMERMERLGGWLTENDYRYEAVDSADMDKYCPADVSIWEQNKAAGLRCLKEEWHGKTPDLATFDLALFQMATLVGHLRAWQRIVDNQTPALILEDDADIASADVLQATLQQSQSQGADAILLDHRHCVSAQPPFLQQTASGLAGYWVNVKAATTLLAKFPLNMPVDYGVNQIFNKDVKAVCPGSYPVGEYGGPYVARKDSAAHGCKPGNDGGFLQGQQPHPAASMLAGLFSFD